ncbi:MAG TPA: transposase, partial [Marmoricola sp.]
ARGSSSGGLTFHDRGGPYGRTNGAKRVVAVDVTGLPVGALVAPASTHENRTTQLMLQHLTEQDVSGRLQLVLVDRGVTAAAARALGRDHDLELRLRTPPPQPADSRSVTRGNPPATARSRGHEAGSASARNAE